MTKVVWDKERIANFRIAIDSRDFESVITREDVASAIDEIERLQSEIEKASQLMQTVTAGVDNAPS